MFFVVVVGFLLTRLVKLADHVDILGRMSLNDLILQVAGGRGELINETIHSNIREYAEKVKIYEEEA
jgi:phospholipid:diacylglycerol acyltransferase